ncbi:hypothetical protein N7457_009608 [Penicillium paradoxum]|uniref:uncharacterized protein n=1 Tax=Penicillium paradoxum TaxID=176176 RepID=UPI0025491D4F|nr:uncharacterized protein N7457_009608 [Penicillium paradoxum]KAJ5774712.1 hypothetical protein N7457_009608 [Penicillium paradoxum]
MDDLKPLSDVLGVCGILSATRCASEVATPEFAQVNHRAESTGSHVVDGTAPSHHRKEQYLA